MRSTTKAVLCLSAFTAITVALVGPLSRPATASSRTAEAGFAVVDAIGLLEQMLQSPEYQNPRNATRTKYETQMQQLQTANAALANMLQNMDQNDPSFQVNVATYQNQQYQMQDLGGQFSEELDTIASEQATEIYAKIVEAINAVAAREGIDNVISNRTAPTAEEALGLAGVTQQILARPVIRTNAVDLTVAVRNELGLPDPAIAKAKAKFAEEAVEEMLKAAQTPESGEATPAEGDQPAEDQPADDGEG